MEELYTLYNSKDESFHHFMNFFRFMIEKQRYHSSKENEDFVYHFDRLPKYLEELLSKIRYDTIQDIATIGMVVDRTSKNMNKLTNLSKGEN